MNPDNIMRAFAHGQPDPEQPTSLTAARLRLARSFGADARDHVADQRPDEAATCARIAARFARAAAGYKETK